MDKGSTALTDNGNISGSQTATLSIDQVGPSDAGLYHVLVKGTAACGDVVSADAELQVNENIIISTQPAPQTVCTGSTATFSVTTSTGTGLTYQWRKAGVDLTDGGNISGATTATLSIANVSAADIASYRVFISDGSAGCPNVISANAALGVSPTSVGGTVNSDATICYNTGGSLNLTGKTGTVVRWESSTDGGANWTTVVPSNTSTALNYANLTQTTEYRAVVQSGVCPEANSVFATITVNPNLVAGTVGANQTICYNTAPAAFTSSTLPTGGTGSYTYQWQSAPALAGPYTNIAGATLTTYAPGALTATTYYRRNETSGTCGTVSSNVITVTVNPNLVAGTVAANQTICYNTAPAAFTSSTSNRWNRFLYLSVAVSLCTCRSIYRYCRSNGNDICTGSPYSNYLLSQE